MERRLLMKFGQEEHMKRLQKEGLFHCKHIKYFVELDDGKTRGDEFEAVVELNYIAKGYLKVKPAKDLEAEWKEFEMRDCLMKKKIINPTGNLYCMSSITVDVQEEPCIYRFDSKFHSFGTHFLLITNQVEFLERLNTALEKLGVDYCHGSIDYLDFKKHIGEKSLFQKDSSYSWQEEYRIFFDSGKIEPIEFSIGSIEDISSIYSLSEVPAFLLKDTTPEENFTDG